MAAQRAEGPTLRLIRSDMRSFQLAQRFDRILIPYSAIFCMLSREDVILCLKTCAAHLAPGGRVVFDAYSADAFHLDWADDLNRLEERDRFEDLVTIEHRGQTYDVLEQSSWERSDQRLEVVYLHEPRDGGEAIRASLVHRYILSDQIEPLLLDAGLRLEALHGDYRGGPLDEESELLVVIARQ